MSTPLILFGVILFHVVLAVSIFWLAWRKGRASIRLMALLIAMVQISLGIFVWFAIPENWVIFFAFIFAVLNGLVILSLPLTAPKLYKNLKIKW